MNQDRKETTLIMFAALLLAFVRSPLLLIHGRVIAEEGTVYFQKAWDSSALDALFAIHQGYYSLFTNGVALLAEKLVPLEWAAFVFTFVSLLILMLTVYLAITCEVFQDSRSRWMAAGIVMLTPSIEVWLTAEDVQFYLAVCTALICLSSERRHRILRFATLLLAGLSGVVSCALTPFFLLRAYRRRTLGAVLQAGVLAACCSVQGVIILHTLHDGGRKLSSADKVRWFGPVMFLKIFAVTFFGRLGAFLSQHIVIRHTNTAVCLLFWLLAFLSLAFFWKVAKTGGEPAMVCFCMAIASLVFDYSAIGEPLQTIFIGAFRYVFTGFLLLWLIPVLAYAKARSNGSSHDQKIALYFALLILSWGAMDTVGYWTRFQCLTPEWSGQVAAWRKDPNTPIRVAPYDWPLQMHLRPH